MLISVLSLLAKSVSCETEPGVAGRDDAGVEVLGDAVADMILDGTGSDRFGKIEGSLPLLKSKDSLTVEEVESTANR